MSKFKKLKLTQTGLELLENELKERVEITRRKLQDDLDAEMGEGDLSENTSYYRVQDEIASNERRIEELKDMISNAIILEDNDGSDITHASIGSTVTIKVKDREVTYTIVGSTEADPTQNKISVDSPFGKALIGKKVGEKAVVRTPAGEQQYDIIRIA